MCREKRIEDGSLKMNLLMSKHRLKRGNVARVDRKDGEDFLIVIFKFMYRSNGPYPDSSSILQNLPTLSTPCWQDENLQRH